MNQLLLMGLVALALCAVVLAVRAHAKRGRPAQSAPVVAPPTLPAETTAENATAEAAGTVRSQDGAKAFLAAASHDLRQPLQAMKLLTNVLAHSEDAAQRREIVANMGDALGIMEHLLDSLVDLAKLDSGVVVPEVEVFAVGEILSRIAARAQSRARKCGIELRVVACGAGVRSDPRWLARIVEGFLDNAINHSGSGKVLLGCRRSGRQLGIEVWDAGAGVAREQRNQIFEPFHQIGAPERDRHQGLGLGLAIARRAAALLDHPITLDSTPGRRTVFAIEVPIVARPSQASAEDPATRVRAAV